MLESSARDICLQLTCTPVDKPSVMVFILDQNQAVTLEEQLVDSFNLLASKPYGAGRC